jgi:lipopolysaccharide transport system permease protein
MLIRPVLTVLVFTTIFGRLVKLLSDGTARYALMVFAGMLPWTFFSTGLAEASNSIISNLNLVNKVYFPRFAGADRHHCGGLRGFSRQLLHSDRVDGLVSITCVANHAVAAFYVLGFLTSLGPSLYITAPNVKYRTFAS